MILDTLRQAPARIARGFERTVARGYRYEGEREAHADQLRQTQISLSLMESAAADDPAQIIMASDIEDDAESRLAVLLGKARLTLEEKRERDAIQAAISRRRQALAGGPVLVPREAPTRVLGLLGPAAGPLAPILMSPATWVAIAFALPATWGGIQTARLNNAKDTIERVRAQRDAPCSPEELSGQTTRAACVALQNANNSLSEAGGLTRDAAQNWERERARAEYWRNEARRIRDAMDQARAGGPVDYGFGGVRDNGASAPGANSGNPADGNPG